MSSRNILVVIHTAVYGGPHCLVERLATPLAHRGWSLHVVLPNEAGSGAARLEQAGLETHRIQLQRLRRTLDPRVHFRYAFGFAPETAELRRIARTIDADLVQVVGLMHLQGALAAQLERLPLVWQFLSDFAPMPVRRVLMPVVKRTADCIMTTGIGTARVHPGALSFGERLVPFYMPVDTNEYRPNDEARLRARAHLGVSDDSFLIGTVGNQNRQKGHEYFVEAAHLLSRTQPKVRFRILGGHTPALAPYYEREVRMRAQRLGLFEQDRLRIEDPGADVASLLPAFDLFWLTSRAEGTPTAVIEALSCGVPVIATDVGSLAEMLEENVTGFVIPPCLPERVVAATLPLLRDRSRLNEMSRNARSSAVARFDLEVCADLHADAYRRAVEHAQGRGRREPAQPEEA